MTIKNHFHINGFALNLALKVRLFGTRKWPIDENTTVSGIYVSIKGVRCDLMVLSQNLKNTFENSSVLIKFITLTTTIHLTVCLWVSIARMEKRM